MPQGVSRSPAIEALFRADVVAVSAEISSEHLDALRPEELDGIDRMIETRRIEFATGRACARFVAATLGHDAAIPRGERREPLWPAPLTGSLSHTRGWCVAVAARRDDVAAIGIDVEQIDRLHERLERRILTEPEVEVVSALSSPERQRASAIAFAAKEAFYKAHHQLEARYFGFDAVSITIVDDTVRFEVGSGVISADVVAATSGRFFVDDGLVTCGVWIDR